MGTAIVLGRGVGLACRLLGSSAEGAWVASAVSSILSSSVGRMSMFSSINSTSPEKSPHWRLAQVALLPEDMLAASLSCMTELPWPQPLHGQPREPMAPGDTGVVGVPVHPAH